jgi:hypothetical protein
MLTLKNHIYDSATGSMSFKNYLDDNKTVHRQFWQRAGGWRQFVTHNG